ncbi:TonB-dependent receptor plug domain-containing protein [Novosphingobium sp. 9]|uniref:TonB-dependent receptor plug domain-containing protein n=1 Tax=Novosphingobium sp. 9 TaxID=2025349 RepID=UPI0021B61580|nr:TonB-dependent receptor plug domain-containing protein [Novosphingobium sp. 9]
MAQAVRPVEIRAEPGPLVDVLRAISRQSGVQIVTSVSPALKTRARLRGCKDAGSALARATRGLPVRVVRLDSGFVVTQANASGRQSPGMPPPPREATPTEALGDGIVVTGYRQSLREALVRKRAAADIREVTRAEDIAEFPDRNAAEALQRLPGVAISRDNGEGRQVSLRALARCSRARP